jgi:hypothetical protein
MTFAVDAAPPVFMAGMQIVLHGERLSGLALDGEFAETVG